MYYKTVINKKVHQKKIDVDKSLLYYYLLVICYIRLFVHVSKEL